MKNENHDYQSNIKLITSIAEKARREGLIALEEDVSKIKHPFLKNGLSLVIDGVEPELIEAILITKLQEKKHEIESDAGLFETLGGFAPTMGIIGAIMGLVGALRRMGSAGMENTVEALAVAFIASFWGVAFANLLFLPIAGKVRSRWKDEHVLIQIIMEGILAIQQGNNPHIVQQRLISFLPMNGKVDMAAEEVTKES
jgi:chemotaxis protein MotA